MGYNQAVDDAAKDTRVAELEAALRDALGSFKCTQHVLSYPESHWSRRACALLNEGPEQPSYLTFVRTAGGDEVTCTPNHPILTDHGWVAAGQLKKGQQPEPTKPTGR